MPTLLELVVPSLLIRRSGGSQEHDVASQQRRRSSRSLGLRWLSSEDIDGLAKTTAYIAGPDVGRIDVDLQLVPSADCRSQAEKARFNLLAVLIQLAQGKPSLILRNGPHAAEGDDHNHDQKLEKCESG